MSIMPRTGVCMSCGHDHGNGMGLPRLPWSAQVTSPIPAAPVPTDERPREEFLDLALNCGANLTGKPDGSEPITVVFSIEAWRKFDKASLAAVPASEPVQQIDPQAIIDEVSELVGTSLFDEVRAHDLVCAFRKVLAMPAAPAPVSGMPDLVSLQRYASWQEGDVLRINTPFDNGQFVKLADVERLLNPTGETK